MRQTRVSRAARGIARRARTLTLHTRAAAPRASFVLHILPRSHLRLFDMFVIDISAL